VGDLFAIYDGSRHPDVALGRIGPEDATLDFRESFEMHHNTIHDYSPDAPVSKEEFIEFYAYISAMTESDHVFDQAVTGPWNLDRRLPSVCDEHQLSREMEARSSQEDVRRKRA